LGTWVAAKLLFTLALPRKVTERGCTGTSETNRRAQARPIPKKSGQQTLQLRVMEARRNFEQFLMVSDHPSTVVEATGCQSGD